MFLFFANKDNEHNVGKKHYSTVKCNEISAFPRIFICARLVIPFRNKEEVNDVGDEEYPVHNIRLRMANVVEHRANHQNNAISTAIVRYPQQSEHCSWVSVP